MRSSWARISSPRYKPWEHASSRFYRLRDDTTAVFDAHAVGRGAGEEVGRGGSSRREKKGCGKRGQWNSVPHGVRAALFLLLRLPLTRVRGRGVLSSPAPPRIVTRALSLSLFPYYTLSLFITSFHFPIIILFSHSHLLTPFSLSVSQTNFPSYTLININNSTSYLKKII